MIIKIFYGLGIAFVLFIIIECAVEMAVKAAVKEVKDELLKELREINKKSSEEA